jgi:hypothetical protein
LARKEGEKMIRYMPKPDEEGVIDKDISDTEKINLPVKKAARGYKAPALPGQKGRYYEYCI